MPLMQPRTKPRYKQNKYISVLCTSVTAAIERKQQHKDFVDSLPPDTTHLPVGLCHTPSVSTTRFRAFPKPTSPFSCSPRFSSPNSHSKKKYQTKLTKRATLQMWQRQLRYLQSCKEYRKQQEKHKGEKDASNHSGTISTRCYSHRQTQKLTLHCPCSLVPMLDQQAHHR